MKLGDKVRYKDTICTVVGLHKENNEIIVTYKDGWIFDKSLVSLTNNFTTKGLEFEKTYYFTSKSCVVPIKILKKI